MGVFVDTAIALDAPLDELLDAARCRYDVGFEPVAVGETRLELLQITDVAETMFSVGDTVPVWAAQAAANLRTCGILQTNSSGTLGLEETMTRGSAAEMLLGAMDVLDSRESGGLFSQ